MPLTRQEIGAYDSDRGIVEFTMSEGSRIVRCAISTAAMDDLEASSGTKSNKRVEQFTRLRDRVEARASQKFDEGSLEAREPRVVLRSHDFDR